AATISLIKELKYKDYVMKFDVETWKTAPALKQQLDEIRFGMVADKHNWLFKI
ncbi:MAG: branched chain amino acid aminotransferase, partial [Sphingobacteriales bacterium]|nr:branched chain amino acid aminotransferase [Sphingobacteriales bacterium]